MKVFPRTPHLSWSGHVGRDDLQLSEAASRAFLASMTIVQEKLDGANVSVRCEYGRLILENRGKSISAHPQFAPFKAWAAARPQLRDLGERTLFGEWLYAEHGTPYNALPDYFIAYDIYDPQLGFLANTDVVRICTNLGIAMTPNLRVPRDEQGLLSLASGQSCFGAGPREGLYCRIENDKLVVDRAKLVRPGYEPRSNAQWEKGIVGNALAQRRA